MDEGKKKKIKIVVIVLVIILSIIALVETGLLLSMRSKLDQINSDNNQIQNRLENS